MGLEGLKQNLIKGKEAVFFKLHSAKYVYPNCNYGVSIGLPDHLKYFQGHFFQ